MTQDDPAARLRQHLAERFGSGESPTDPLVPPEDEPTDQPTEQPTDQPTDEPTAEEDQDGQPAAGEPPG